MIASKPGRCAGSDAQQRRMSATYAACCRSGGDGSADGAGTSGRSPRSTTAMTTCARRQAPHAAAKTSLHCAPRPSRCLVLERCEHEHRPQESAPKLSLYLRE